MRCYFLRKLFKMLKFNIHTSLLYNTQIKIKLVFKKITLILGIVLMVV